LICVFKGYGMAILSRGFRDVGDTVRFEIENYRKYKEGKLVAAVMGILGR